MSLPEIVFITYWINAGTLLAVVIYMLYTSRRPRWVKIITFVNIGIYTILVLYSVLRISLLIKG